MKKYEYMAKVLPDGHLSLPMTIANQLNLKVNSNIRIRIFQDDKKRGLNRFCGKWQGEQNAEEIVSQIYSEREKNNRSETQE